MTRDCVKKLLGCLLWWRVCVLKVLNVRRSRAARQILHFGALFCGCSPNFEALDDGSATLGPPNRDLETRNWLAAILQQNWRKFGHNRRRFLRIVKVHSHLGVCLALAKPQHLSVTRQLKGRELQGAHLGPYFDAVCMNATHELNIYRNWWLNTR